MLSTNSRRNWDSRGSDVCRLSLPLFFVTFAFLFGPRFHVVDIHTVSTISLAVVGIVFIILERRVLKRVMLLLVITMIPWSYSVLISSIHGGLDFTVPWVLAKFLAYTFAAYALVKLYFATFDSANAQVILSRHIIFAALINALFVLIILVNPLVRHVLSTMVLRERNIDWAVTGHRSFDLSLGGGAAASIVFSAILCYAIASRSFLRGRLLRGLIYSVLLIATVFTGRTGTLLIPIGIAMLWLTGPYRNTAFTLSSVGKDLFTVGIICALLVVGLSIFMPEVIERIRNEVFPWAFEVFYSGGVANVASVRAIATGYFIPKDDIDTIFGTSNAGRGELLPFIYSDVGYIRSIFAVGIIGTILLYAIFVYLLFFGLRWVHRSPLSCGLLIYCLFSLIANFKEFHVFHRGGGALLATLYVGISMALSHKGRQNSGCISVSGIC